MKFAKLTKLGGDLISASEADYIDYAGFLRCPECDEPVFLRKAHSRGETAIPDAFVHHKAVPEISACQLRVGNYSPEYVANVNAQARGQRLHKLQLSMWKFLKRNLAVSFKSWSAAVRDAKEWPFLGEVVKYGEEVLESNRGYIISTVLPTTAELLSDRDPHIQVAPGAEAMIDTFLKGRSRDWQRHCAITEDALDLFLSAKALAEVRHRFCCCLCHLNVLKGYPNLLDLDTATLEWKEQFVAFLTLYVTLVFLSVDWISEFDRMK